MKILPIVAILLLSACKDPQQAAEIPDHEIFREFQQVLVSGDFEKLASHIDGGVLETFRQRLEFTTDQPLEGSWFSGSRKIQPTKEQLNQFDDSQFFTVYMEGFESVLGNPLGERFRGAEVVTETIGTLGYRHFVVTRESDYAFPTVFSFKREGERWILVAPSIIETYANSLRASRGRIPEG